MQEKILTDIAWFVIAATIATVLFRKINRYIWGRKKGESLISFFQRAESERREEEAIQNRLNINPAAAQRIRWTNFIALILVGIGVDHLLPLIGINALNNMILGFAAYIVTGMIICARRNVVSGDTLAGLNFSNRVTVRLYYAWLWPLNVVKTRVSRR